MSGTWADCWDSRLMRTIQINKQILMTHPALQSHFKHTWVFPEQCKTGMRAALLRYCQMPIKASKWRPSARLRQQTSGSQDCRRKRFRENEALRGVATSVTKRGTHTAAVWSDGISERTSHWDFIYTRGSTFGDSRPRFVRTDRKLTARNGTVFIFLQLFETLCRCVWGNVS